MRVRHAIILTGSALLVLTGNRVDADVRLENFMPESAVKRQSSVGKSPSKTHRSKGKCGQKMKPRQIQADVIPQKTVISKKQSPAENGSAMGCGRRLQQAGNRSWQFVKRQAAAVKLAADRAVKNIRKWAGQCEGEF